MALKTIATIAPCYTYTPRTGDWHWFWHFFNPQGLYSEKINKIKGFFYDPGKDLFICIAEIIDTYKYYFITRRIAFDGDGSLNSSYTADYPLTGIGLIQLYGSMAAGGYGKIYCHPWPMSQIQEFDWESGQLGTFMTYDWAGKNPADFALAIVNRNDAIVAVTGTNKLYVYNYNTHDLLGTVGIYDWGSSMSYESDRYLWIVHRRGFLAKINYKTCRHEMMSKVIDPASEDISYFCAFDTKRNRLAILRHKPDAEDGACRVQLEFYSPAPQAAVITAPVPVNSLQTEAKITFSAHILGDAGEGIAGQAITPVLEAPAAGSLAASQITSGPCGAFDIEYNAPAESAAETVTAAAEI